MPGLFPSGHTVPVLVPAPLPRGAGHLDSWASREGHDPGQIRRFNPAFPDGRIASADRNLQVLAPARAGRADSAVAAIPVDAPGTTGSRTAVTSVAPVPARAPAAEPVHYAQAVEPPRSHVVARGESVWRIARRYGIGVAQLLGRNGLSGNSVLHPGMTLLIDDVLPAGTAAVETAQGSP